MMRRFFLPALMLMVFAPTPAFAHGFGRTQNLPLPQWLYLFGINAVVLATFVMVALSLGGSLASQRYTRKDLLKIGPLHAVLTGTPFLTALRLLSVTLFVLVILSGLLGSQEPDGNLAPTLVWITWWVGLGFFTIFVGNVWALVNPWKITFGWAQRLAHRLGFGLELGVPYPASLGVWPAVTLYAAFIWVENIFEGSSVPLDIALLAVLYSLLTWTGMAVFGREVWLRGGEVFSVFFGILAMFAPTEARVTDAELCKECGGCRPEGRGCVNCYECFARAAPEKREINLRPLAVGLGLAGQATFDRLVFVVLMLAGVAFDSLLEIRPWAELEKATSMPPTLGMVLLPLLFLALYLGFMRVSQRAGDVDVSFEALASAYVYSFVPIAIAYQVAHYYPYLLVRGQAIIALVSDPFGWGWDLLGTAGYRVHAGIVDAGFVWYSQVALILAGHIVAVYLAHVVALRFMPDAAKAAKSQYPMMALMILYTVFSLWILTQPAAA